MNVTPKFQLFFTIFILALCSQSSHAAEQIAQDYVEQYPILAEGFTLIRTVSSPSFVQKFGVDGYPDFQEFMEEVSSTPLVVLESRAHWWRGCTVRRRSFVHDFDSKFIDSTGRNALQALSGLDNALYYVEVLLMNYYKYPFHSVIKLANQHRIDKEISDVVDKSDGEISTINIDMSGLIQQINNGYNIVELQYDVYQKNNALFLDTDGLAPTDMVEAAMFLYVIAHKDTLFATVLPSYINCCYSCKQVKESHPCDCHYNRSFTLLNFAVDQKNQEITMLLINCGADVNYKIRETDKSALFIAIDSKCNEIVQLLLNAGADIHAIGYEGENALMRAIKCGNDEAISILLAAGIDVNISDNIGETALMCAAWYRCDDAIISLLLQAGADVNKVSFCGQSALSHAVIDAIMTHLSAKSKKNIELFIEAGANLTLVDSAGETPLHFAVQANQIEIVQLLLDAGMDDTKIINQAGKSAADYANTFAMIKLFKDHARNKLKKQITRLQSNTLQLKNPVARHAIDCVIAKKQRELFWKSIPLFS